MMFDMVSVMTPINAAQEVRDEASEFSCQYIANRQVEKSVSDISAISVAIPVASVDMPVTPPPTNNRRRLNRML